MNLAEVNLAEVNLAKIVKSSFLSHSYRRVLRCALAVVFLLTFSACNRGRHRVLEVNYVSAVQATLRDQVATIYNRVGTVKNGERVEVLEHEKRFARVRTAEWCRRLDRATLPGGSTNLRWSAEADER